MSLLFVEASQYIWLGVAFLAIVLFFVYYSSKSKKEQEKMKKMSESLKKGDKVVTSAGVFGTIVDFQQKENIKLVIIETGNSKYKGYMALDASQIIYMEDDLFAKPAEKTENAQQIKNDVKSEQSEKIETSEPKPNTDKDDSLKVEAKEQTKTKKSKK